MFTIHKLLFLFFIFFLFQKKIISQKDSSQFYLEQGLANKKDQKFTISNAFFKKAYILDSNNINILQQLAQSYYELHQYHQSLIYFEKLTMKGDTTNSTLQNNFQINYQLHNYEKAIYYGLMVTKKKSTIPQILMLANSYMAIEKYNIALLKLLDVEKHLNIDDTDILYLKALCYIELDNSIEAYNNGKKYIAQNGSNANKIYEISNWAYTLGKFNEAVTFMNLAKEKGYHTDVIYLENIAKALLAANRSEEALVFVNQLLIIQPNNSRLISSLAESYFNQNNFKNAIEYWGKALAIEQQNSKYLYMIGLSYIKMGNDKKGSDLCDKAILADPSLRIYREKKEALNF